MSRDLPPRPAPEPAGTGRVEVRGDVVPFVGEIDWSNVPRLRSALSEVSGRVQSGFVVDLREVGYLCSGAGAALCVVASCRPRLVVREGSGAERALSIMGFDAVGLLEIER
jgi:hypothetical protein